jgi:hypothetical protein
MGEFDKYIDPARDRPCFACSNHGQRYLLSERVLRPVTSAHVRTLAEPGIRRLRIFATDPATSSRDGKNATAEIPYEPLSPGPAGALFEIENDDQQTGRSNPVPDLDDRGLLLANGYAPSDSNTRFHAQMVYAVASLVHQTFRRALGRQLGWPFAPRPAADGAAVARLRIRPFAGETQNAWYDPNSGTLNFGYFYANEKPTDGTLPRGIVYTALSHDIVCHELTHAMLDSLRSNYVLQTSNDMAGFHEGFSDAIALFHHFKHTDALRLAIANCRGNLRESDYLSSIGKQFGRATGSKSALRSAVNTELTYSEKLPPHQMGELLMASLFDAFVTLYERKTATLRRIATNGTGILPTGDLPGPLVEALSKKATDLATQFLSMLIRAIDYSPPVDVRLGEYLRGIVTADSALVADDPWNYREAFIDAFRLRGIYPRDVQSLNEDSLLWRPPIGTLEPIEKLSFKELWFAGDPGMPVTVGEQIAQACELGEYVTSTPERMKEFGLVSTGDAQLEGDKVTLPKIESVRTLRRIGPDGHAVFDTVAEILQTRIVRPRDGKPGFEIYGGSTVILDSNGDVRTIVLKSVVGERRLDRRLDFLEGPTSRRFWNLEGNSYVPRRDKSPFMALCESGRGDELERFKR